MLMCAMGRSGPACCRGDCGLHPLNEGRGVRRFMATYARLGGMLGWAEVLLHAGMRNVLQITLLCRWRCTAR